MSEISKYRGPAAFRVDPAEGPSWLTFRCEDDLRESGVIKDGDKVIALIELLALRERAGPVVTDYMALAFHHAITDGSAGSDDIDVIKTGLRAALANYAAPPAPVAPEWIACSERMPEVGDIVLTADSGCVNVGEMESSGASCRYFTSVVSGRELPATHWMPLPAAPGKEG